MLLQDKRVRFAAYKRPHPLEHLIEVKIQTNGDCPPKIAMLECLEKLEMEVERLKAKFEEQVKKF